MMKPFSLFRPLLAVALALTCSFPTQAANYVKLTGSNIDFYYDVDAYGVDGITVNGNTLDIKLQLSLAQSDNVTQMGSLFAVAHSGFNLGVTPTMVMQGTYETERHSIGGADTGGAYGLIAQNAWFGTVVNGQFVLNNPDDETTTSTVAVGSTNLYNGQSGQQTFTLSAGAEAVSWNSPKEGETVPQWTASALSYDTLFQLFYHEQPGTFNTVHSAIATGGKLIFDVQAIAAVPEPGSWALSLAGLGLLGGVLRRRAANRSC